MLKQSSSGRTIRRIVQYASGQRPPGTRTVNPPLVAQRYRRRNSQPVATGTVAETVVPVKAQLFPTRLLASSSRSWNRHPPQPVRIERSRPARDCGRSCPACSRITSRTFAVFWRVIAISNPKWWATLLVEIASPSTKEFKLIGQWLESCLAKADGSGHKINGALKFAGCYNLEESYPAVAPLLKRLEKWEDLQCPSIWEIPEDEYEIKDGEGRLGHNAPGPQQVDRVAQASPWRQSLGVCGWRPPDGTLRPFRRIRLLATTSVADIYRRLASDDCVALHLAWAHLLSTKPRGARSYHRPALSRLDASEQKVGRCTETAKVKFRIGWRPA